MSLRGGAAVDAQHDLGVEHSEQRLEVALAGGGEERVDELALAGESVSGSGVAPRTRRRARLASCRVAAGERSTIGAISSNGTANMSCRTNASRSAGASVSSTTSSASPTRVGQQRLVLRVVPSRSRSARAGAPRAAPRAATRASAACRARRARRPSSATPAGCRPRRCRSGAAAAMSPARRRRPRSPSRASGRPRPAVAAGSSNRPPAIRLVHGHILPSRSVYGVTYRTAPM